MAWTFWVELGCLLALVAAFASGLWLRRRREWDEYRKAAMQDAVVFGTGVTETPVEGAPRHVPLEEFLDLHFPPPVRPKGFYARRPRPWRPRMEQRRRP